VGMGILPVNERYFGSRINNQRRISKPETVTQVNSTQRKAFTVKSYPKVNATKKPVYLNKIEPNKTKPFQ
jgi:hypothetical protein